MTEPDLTTPSSQRANRLPRGMYRLTLPPVLAASNQRRPSRDILLADPRDFPHGLFFSGPGGCTWIEVPLPHHHERYMI
jgi:hypothetical protein